MLHNRLTRLVCLARHQNLSTSYVAFNEKQSVPSFKELNENLKKKIDEDKENLIWRNKPLDQPYAFKSKFRVFGSEELEPK